MKYLFQLLMVLIAVLCAVTNIYSAEKPNIVFMMADNLGYGDLGCYGSARHRTPRLDRAAKEGATHEKRRRSSPATGTTLFFSTWHTCTSMGRCACPRSI